MKRGITLKPGVREMKQVDDESTIGYDDQGIDQINLGWAHGCVVEESGA